MSVLWSFVSEWYQWLIGLPLVSAAGAWSWKNREFYKLMFRKLKFLWNLDEQVKRAPATKSDREQVCPSRACRTPLRVYYTVNCGAGNQKWYYFCDKCRTKYEWIYKPE